MNPLRQRFPFLFLAFLLALTAAALPAQAAVPSTMSYQGVLTSDTGVPLGDGAYSLTFRLYSVSSGGSALWTETQPSVQVTGSVFSVTLGSVTPLNLPFDQPYWLGVSVGADPELAPRTALTSSPYALALRTPLPGVTQVIYPGGYSVIGNANPPTDALWRDIDLNYTAPADGYVMLQVTAYVQNVNVTTNDYYYVKYQISETTNASTQTVPSDFGYFYYAGFGFAPNNGYFDWPLSCTRIIPVTAGAHRFSFCTGRQSNSPTGDPGIGNFVMTAVFYPTNYGAVQTAPSGPLDPKASAVAHVTPMQMGR